MLLSYPSFWEKYGIQIVPDHFYFPVPSISDIESKSFRRTSQCLGLDWNINEQENHLDHVFGKYIHELKPRFQQKMISSIDSTIYYSMIRHYRPKKIIEIGGGESTRVAALACVRNLENAPCELVCIEPFPSKELADGFDGLSRLIKARVQEVSLNEFTECDMVFIDSSHIVKIGSDVVMEILEIVPRVKARCLIHWHDIYIPREYPEEWVKQRLFWSEQYLLRAFLMFNRHFEIIWASQFMYQRNQEQIKKIFQDHGLHDYPISSLWVRRVA